MLERLLVIYLREIYGHKPAIRRTTSANEKRGRKNTKNESQSRKFDPAQRKLSRRQKLIKLKYSSHLVGLCFESGHYIPLYRYIPFPEPLRYPFVVSKFSFQLTALALTTAVKQKLSYC